MRNEKVAEVQREDLAPPEHLSASAKALWLGVVPSKVRHPARLAVLLEGLEARDQAAAARAMVTAEGLVVTSERSGLAHPHPALKVEEAGRRHFLRCWTQLGLAARGIGYD